MKKISIQLFALITVFCLGISLIQAQTTTVDFELVYSTVNCNYEAHAHVSGLDLGLPNTINFPATFTVVVPESATSPPVPSTNPGIPVTASFEPTGIPWNNVSSTYAPAADPTSNFHTFSVIGGGSPNAYMDFTNGSDILLFTFELPTLSCGSGIRLYVNGSDPDSSAPGMQGKDHRQTFKIFPNIDIYVANISDAPITLEAPLVAPTVNCAGTIDLMANATVDVCADGTATTYAWEGPDGLGNPTGFTSTDQNPSIPITNPVMQAGIYSVTVTDSKGCETIQTVTLDAVSCPMPCDNCFVDDCAAVVTTPDVWETITDNITYETQFGADTCNDTDTPSNDETTCFEFEVLAADLPYTFTLDGQTTTTNCANVTPIYTITTENVDGVTCDVVTPTIDNTGNDYWTITTAGTYTFCMNVTGTDDGGTCTIDQTCPAIIEVCGDCLDATCNNAFQTNYDEFDPTTPSATTLQADGACNTIAPAVMPGDQVTICTEYTATSNQDVGMGITATGCTLTPSDFAVVVSTDDGVTCTDETADGTNNGFPVYTLTNATTYNICVTVTAPAGCTLDELCVGPYGLCTDCFSDDCDAVTTTPDVWGTVTDPTTYDAEPTFATDCNAAGSSNSETVCSEFVVTSIPYTFTTDAVFMTSGTCDAPMATHTITQENTGTATCDVIAPSTDNADNDIWTITTAGTYTYCVQIVDANPACSIDEICPSIIEICGDCLTPTCNNDYQEDYDEFVADAASDNAGLNTDGACNTIAPALTTAGDQITICTEYTATSNQDIGIGVSATTACGLMPSDFTTVVSTDNGVTCINEVSTGTDNGFTVYAPTNGTTYNICVTATLPSDCVLDELCIGPYGICPTGCGSYPWDGN